MPARIYEGELDDIGHEPGQRIFPECRCDDIGKGSCQCEDDGTASHGGNAVEADDHGVGPGGFSRNLRRRNATQGGTLPVA